MHVDPKIKEIPFQPSTVENVDMAMFSFLDKELNLHVDTNKGWKKTPIIWISAERAFQVKRAASAPGAAATIRDSAGALILPVITLERTSIIKDPTKKGTAWANLPPIKQFEGDPKGGSITIARRIQQDKTANFANADSYKSGGQVKARKQINFRTRGKKQKIVYQTITTPMPVYLDITYSVLLKTEYQEQMNQLITPFATKTGGVNYFTLRRDGHFYEAFIQSDFSQNNNISTLEQEERKYETKIEIKVLAYIIGGDKNEEKPKIIIRENAVQFRMPRERIVARDGKISDVPLLSRSKGPDFPWGRGQNDPSLKKDDIKTLIAGNSIYREIPTGDINGTNKVFTVSNDMDASSVLVWYNGSLQRPGRDYDYTVVGARQIIFNGAPVTDSYILVNYVKV